MHFFAEFVRHRQFPQLRPKHVDPLHQICSVPSNHVFTHHPNALGKGESFVDSKGSVNEIWHWEGGSRMYGKPCWKAMMGSIGTVT